MRGFMISHPILSLLIFAWVVLAGYVFGPLIDRAYGAWRDRAPERERIAAANRRERARICHGTGWRR